MGSGAAGRPPVTRVRGRRVTTSGRFIVLALLLTVLGGGPAVAAGPAVAGPAVAGPAGSPRGSVPAVPTQAVPTQTVQSRQQHSLTLVIDSINPVTATPTSKITLTGYVQNDTGQPISGMTVRLRYSARPLASRAELEQQAGQSGQTGAQGVPGETAHPQRFSRAVATGTKQPWRLQTTSKELGFRSFGVYPLSVEVDDGTGRALDAQRTFLTFVPKNYKQVLKPTKIAWVWPLMDQPRRTIDSHFRDDRLATEVAADGRLTGLVAAARTAKVPLTWAIDPALLDDVRTMTKPYSVKSSVKPDARDEQKPKSDAATRWLADLKTAAAGDPYFATPYADSDVVALVRRGRSVDVKAAYDPAKRQAIRDTLGPATPEAVAWPPDGVADQKTMDLLSRLGNRVFLLSSDVLPGGSNLTYTPSASVATPSSSGTKYFVGADHTISAVIGGDTHAPGAGVLAEQRFLAETAMITAERPSLQRTVVVAPPRRWNPGPGFAAQLLAGTSTARWLQPASLREVTRAAAPDRTYTGYPAAYGAHELSAGYLKSVRGIKNQALPFSGSFDPPLSGYELGVLRLESSAWRGKRAAKTARRARDALKSQLANDLKTVYFVLNKGPSLAGQIGQVPVTIANDMPDHSITVRLNVESTSARLRVGAFQQVVTIPQKKKVTIQIPMKAAANGKTVVNLALQSRNGKPIGVSRKITVNATGFGRTALLITGGALVVLFLGVGVRVMRARRRNGAQQRRPATMSEPPPPNGTPMPSGRPSERAADAPRD